jgi:hypothetical protein
MLNKSAIAWYVEKEDRTRKVGGMSKQIFQKANWTLGDWNASLSQRFTHWGSLMQTFR